MAVLVAESGAPSDACRVDFSQPAVRIELHVRQQWLLMGTWEVAVMVDDHPVELVGEWECVCWNSDSDGDYFELQQQTSIGLRIERQVFLARTEQIALFAESVADAGGARISVRSRLPLAPRVAAKVVRGEREWRLSPGGVRVFPLAVPQRALDGTPHQVQCVDQGLELFQQHLGTGLYAPLVLSWSEAERRAAADWRTLTVSEEGVLVPGDRASGHRLRVGGRQWLVYRAIARSPEGRAVLGYHTRFESVVGKITAEGTIVPLVQIE